MRNGARRSSYLQVSAASLLLVTIGILTVVAPVAAMTPRPPKFSGALPGWVTCKLSVDVSFSPPLTASSGGTNPSAVEGRLSGCHSNSGAVVVAGGKVTGSFASSPVVCAGLSLTAVPATLTVSWRGGVNGTLGGTAYAGRAAFTATTLSSVINTISNWPPDVDRFTLASTGVGSFAGPSTAMAYANGTGASLGRRCQRSRLDSLALVGTITFGPTTGVDCDELGPHADLQGCDLAGSELNGVDLTGADLSGADMSHVGLVGANLSGTNLSDANLTYANLSGVESGGMTGKPLALPAGWELVQGYLIGPGADLSGANLYRAYLSGSDLSGADLDGADLSSASLNSVDLTNANVTNADLYANLSGDLSGGITGTPAALPPSWSLVQGGYLVGPGADLYGANLSDVDLAGVTLSEGNLSNANLSGADMSGADLGSADLLDANLSGTSLSDANLYWVGSGGITGTPSALPTDWRLAQGGYLIGPGANLSRANLDGLNLSDDDVSDCSLSSASLSDADMSGADLSEDNLSGANLSGTNLSSADLSMVNSGGIIGTPSALPINWSLVQGYLIGPGANLFFAHLSGADLSFADLSGADLSNGAN